MKRNIFRKLPLLLRIGIVVFMLGLIILVIGMNRQSANQAQLDRFPVLSDEAAVREALWGSPKTYILLNAPLTGDTCEDPMGILQEDYVCLECSSYYYVRRERPNDTNVYDYSWDWNDTVARNGSNLMIYGDIPLNTKGYTPHNPAITLDAGSVKTEYVSKLYTDGITSISFYYPNSIGDIEGNVRYKLSGIRQGNQVALLAKLGNGIADLTSLQNVEAPPISGYNDLASLEYAQDEAVGGLALVSFVALAAGFILMVLGAFELLSRLVYGRGKATNTDRKTDQKTGKKTGQTKSQKKKK